MTAVPERWKGICALLQEKNWPVFHNSVDVETILAIAEELGAAEATIREQAQTIERLTKALERVIAAEVSSNPRHHFEAIEAARKVVEMKP